MKAFIMALFSILLCAGLSEVRAQGLSDSDFQRTGRLELELGAGAGMGIDVRSGDRWRSEPTIGIGLNYSYSLPSRILLRAGLSEQYFSSARLIEHPYPYVMDMKTTVETFSARILAGGDWVFFKPEKGHSVFLGLGFYTDFIHRARGYKYLYYISDTEHQSFDLRDSFPDPMPGIQLSLGFLGPGGKIEIRYWEDFHSFDAPEIPTGGQRRSCFVVCGTLFL